MAEMRGFVFAITFIVVFTLFAGSIPTGLLGSGDTPDGVTPVDPSLITGFSSFENWSYSSYSLEGFLYLYSYELNSQYWLTRREAGTLTLGAKILWFGLWLGGVDYCEFGARGTQLTFDEIEADADEGTVTYPLIHVTSGNAAGSLVIFWNATEYSDPADAWAADELQLLHGVGVDSSATTNALTLLLGLLFFSLPDVPVLVNALLITPMWGSIIYVIWFVIKESMPFV